MYTQQELESKSDFELSAMILWNKHCSVITGEPRNDYPNQSRAIYPLKITSSACASIAIFDINNWSDMGPIIHDNKFDINWCRIQGGYYTVNDRDMKISCEHESNELRAAAIVYLLMEQSHE